MYTGGIQIGSTAAAALAVPLAAALGGWRAALVAISLVALALALAWSVLSRGAAPHVRPHVLMPRLPLRSPVSWLLVAIFGSMACAYYGLNAWLPGRLRRARLERAVRGRSPRGDEPDGDRRVVRDPLAVGAATAGDLRGCSG